MKYLLLLIMLLVSTLAQAETYRVETDLSFETEKDAVEFMNSIESVKDKTYKPGDFIDTITPVRYNARAHKCLHDESSLTPCTNYIYIDHDGAVKEHKVGELK